MTFSVQCTRLGSARWELAQNDCGIHGKVRLRLHPNQTDHSVPTCNGTAMADTTATEIFTTTSAFSIAGVFGALAFAYVGLVKLLPKTASKTDRITFVWLVRAALTQSWNR